MISHFYTRYVLFLASQLACIFAIFSEGNASSSFACLQRRSRCMDPSFFSCSAASRWSLLEACYVTCMMCLVLTKFTTLNIHSQLHIISRSLLQSWMGILFLRRR